MDEEVGREVQRILAMPQTETKSKLEYVCVQNKDNSQALRSQSSSSMDVPRPVQMSLELFLEAPKALHAYKYQLQSNWDALEKKKPLMPIETTTFVEESPSTTKKSFKQYTRP